MVAENTSRASVVNYRSLASFGKIMKGQLFELRMDVFISVNIEYLDFESDASVLRFYWLSSKLLLWHRWNSVVQ